jgi:hypothetical protein
MFVTLTDAKGNVIVDKTKLIAYSEKSETDVDTTVMRQIREIFVDCQ